MASRRPAAVVSSICFSARPSGETEAGLFGAVGRDHEVLAVVKAHVRFVDGVAEEEDAEVVSHAPQGTTRPVPAPRLFSGPGCAFGARSARYFVVLHLHGPEHPPGSMGPDPRSDAFKPDPGRSHHSIAVELGVTDKTAAKAIRWFQGRWGRRPTGRRPQAVGFPPGIGSRGCQAAAPGGRFRSTRPAGRATAARRQSGVSSSS